MTSRTMVQARDAIIAHFENEWVNTLGLEQEKIFYQNRRGDKPESGEFTWCKFYLFNTGFNKSSLTNVDGVSQYDRNALLLVELMTPCDDGVDDITTQAVVDMFEGGVASLSGIWFRNVTPNEIGGVDNWYQTNITAEIEYNQVK